MKFTKMCGAGNDFILLNNFDGSFSQCVFRELAKKLCRRHFSVGADGIMVLQPPDSGGDCKMLFFNNDGTSAEMCGNGARCICRYCYDNGLAGETQRIETTAGMVTGERVADDCYKIRLNTPSIVKLDVSLKSTACDYLELGQPGIPHAVVQTDVTQPRERLREFARAIRHSAQFHSGANVNLYAVTSPDTVQLLTFERGVENFTLACGTGTGATVAALTLRGDVSGKNVRVQTDGGTLTVDVVLRNGAVQDLFLTGDAQMVYEGVLTSVR